MKHAKVANTNTVGNTKKAMTAIISGAITFGGNERRAFYGLLVLYKHECYGNSSFAPFTSLVLLETKSIIISIFSCF